MNSTADGFFKIPNSGYQLQINPKFQAPNLKQISNLKLQIPNRFKSDCFFVWDFEFRSLEFPLT